MERDVVRLSKVSFSYFSNGGREKKQKDTNKREKTFVLYDISCSVHDKECVCIAGENGAGKSTLAKIMATILTPTSGSIRVPRNIGYVSQNIDLRSPVPLSVRDVVLMAHMRKGKRFFSRRDREKTEKILEVCGLLPFASRKARTLSGGEKQKVFIARAIATEAEIVVLDEVFAHLDVISRKSIVELLRGIKRNCPIVLVCHDIDVVSELVDTIFCITPAKKSVEHDVFLNVLRMRAGHIPITHLHGGDCKHEGT